MPLVFDCQHERYNHAELFFNSLSHLGTLGLIQFDNFAGFVPQKLPKKITVRYDQRPLELTLPGDTNNRLAVGKVLLTRAGYDLARVCSCEPADGFFDDVYNIWANQGLVTKKEPGPREQGDG